MKLSLDTKERKFLNKSALRRFKKAGNIPAIVYSEGKEGYKISVNQREFQLLIRDSVGGIAIISMKLDGREIQTIIKDKQIHPVSREYTHIDFQELLEGKTLSLEIPIKYVGVPIGVGEGGILDVIHRKLAIECLPKNIPEEVEVDVANLGMNDAIHVSDVEIDDVEIHMLADTALAVVLEPKGLEEEVEETDELLEGEEATETEEGEDSEASDEKKNSEEKK